MDKIAESFGIFFFGTIMVCILVTAVYLTAALITGGLCA